MVSWSKDFILEFIELFKSQEPLWHIKSKDYYNKGKRNACYDLLLNKIKTVEEDANRDVVTKKINNLRSSFRKEYKKVMASLVSGASTDDIYKPKLWYYDHLLFLRDQEEPLQSTSSMSNDIENVLPEESTQYTTSNVRSPDSPLPSSQLSSSNSRGFKRKQPNSYSDSVLHMIGDRLTNVRQEDEYDIIGKNVAAKLRNLINHQKIYAEKIINDTLYEAQLNNLNQFACLNIPQIIPNDPATMTNNYIRQTNMGTVVQGHPSQIILKRAQSPSLLPVPTSELETNTRINESISEFSFIL